jgi:hypothetical protein
VIGRRASFFASVQEPVMLPSSFSLMIIGMKLMMAGTASMKSLPGIFYRREQRV